jgi:sugar-specific transcriptional regulator TrmB
MDEMDTKAVKLLLELGFTNSQARVYVTLAANGNLGVANLASLSEVHRTDLYRVVKELEKKGFVERIIANPTMFGAVPFDVCLDFLIQERAEKFRRLRQEVKELKLTFVSKAKNKKTSKQAKFVLVPGRGVVERIGRSINETEKNAELVISSMRFIKGMFAFSDTMKKSWDRGVKWRIVIYKDRDSKDFWKWIKFCKKSQLCQIKLTAEEPRNVIGIYDQKQVFIIDNPNSDLTESPALWSSNLGLIQLAEDQFNRIWKQGSKCQITGQDSGSS